MTFASHVVNEDSTRIRVTTWTAGTEHDVVSAGPSEAVFVEVELKVSRGR